MTPPAIRRTKETLDVLEVLLAAAGAEVYGWAIAKELQLGGPTVYKILDRLAANDMLTSRWTEHDPDSNRPRRRMYRMTANGETLAVQLLDHRDLFIRTQRD